MIPPTIPKPADRLEWLKARHGRAVDEFRRRKQALDR